MAPATPCGEVSRGQRHLPVALAPHIASLCTRRLPLVYIGQGLAVKGFAAWPLEPSPTRIRGRAPSRATFRRMYKYLAGVAGIALSLILVTPAGATPPNRNSVKYNRDGSITLRSSECVTQDEPSPLFLGSTGTIIPLEPLVSSYCLSKVITTVPGYVDPDSDDTVATGIMRFSAQAVGDLPDHTIVVRGEFCNVSRFPSAWTFNSFEIITPSGHVEGWCKVSLADVTTP